MLNRRNTSVVVTSDIGIAVSVMNVVLTLSKNKNRMKITNTAPITRLADVEDAAIDEVLEPNNSELDHNVGGKRFFGVARFAEISSVRARVSM